MNVWMIVINSLWAALFATGFGVILTTPARALVSCFVCGFMGRFARDVFMGWGLSQNWSTVLAATAIVLAAAAIVRGHRVSPVVLICGILPLGAAVAMFNTIFELMKVSALKGEALSGASIALSANAGKAFTGTLAIALGLGVGMAIMRLLRHDEAAGI